LGLFGNQGGPLGLGVLGRKVQVARARAEWSGVEWLLMLPHGGARPFVSAEELLAEVQRDANHHACDMPEGVLPVEIAWVNAPPGFVPPRAA
jgi:hypothetical protein